MSPSDARRSRLPELLVLFFLSGVSALIYQVLWMRLLALVFGVTIHAASTVLAAFMAGLALGSMAAGRLADRVERPLLAFAIAEAAVAMVAMSTPLALQTVEALYVQLHTVLAGWPTVIAAVRFALSFGVLVVPTILMGATLPLIVKAALETGGVVGRQVSLLYAGNTAGAVAGALAAGLWLVPQLGTSWTFRVAASINLLVGLSAFGIERLGTSPSRERTAAAEATPSPSQIEQPAISPLARRLVLVSVAISGFVSFGLEIVWFRMLVVLFRPTTYAFTIMLATVLAGIAAGSWIASALTGKRRGDLLTRFALLQLTLAIVAMGSMWTIGHAGSIFAWVEPRSQGTLFGYFGPLAASSVAAIAPAAIVMGMAFPVGIALWMGGAPRRETGRRLGVVYAVNVIGAVAGSLVTGFALLPTLGSRVTLTVLAGLTLTIGLVLLLHEHRRAPRFLLAAVALGIFGLSASLTSDPVLELLRSRYANEVPIWRQEDGHASVAILQRPVPGANPINVLYINGAHQASDNPTMVAYHRLIGTLPLAIHPDPKNALVIGAGGGATAGAVAAFSDRLQVDVVELSTAVTAAARRFGTSNQHLFDRPNVHVSVDDGRNHMLLTRTRYDVVTADVILPTHAGAGNLYSTEYYGLMRRVLNPGGIAVQWIGSAGETEYKLIMRTFASVFPHTTLWQGGSLLVGSSEPLLLDEAAFVRKQASPLSTLALDALGFPNFAALLARYDAGPAEIQAFVGAGPSLTDDRPLTEYFLALPLHDKPVDLSRLRGDVRRHVVSAASPSGS